MKYTKAFENYWRNANPEINLPEIPWVHERVKRAAYNAWKASRRAIVHLKMKS